MNGGEKIEWGVTIRNKIIILTLLVILFFTLGSIGAQSVSAADLNNSKSLKSGSISSNSTKATASSITNKVKANVTKKTTNVTKASSNKTKEAKTTINKKTLAKTSTNFVNYVEKSLAFFLELN